MSSPDQTITEAAAPILRLGSDGEWVEYLQAQLAGLGHDPGTVDGDFGPRTEAAVVDFQADAGISVDGIVGPQTWGTLGITCTTELATSVAEWAGDVLADVIPAWPDDEPDQQPEATSGPTADEFVDLCLSQAGDPYEKSGGWSKKDKADDDPDGFDCSGLVQWACAQLGVDFTGRASELIDRCDPQLSVEEATQVRGALIYSFPEKNSSASGHVVVSLGDGTHVDASFSRGSVGTKETSLTYYDRAGLIPGIVYPDRG
ncbi:MAG: peptidoglycan-binding protein [Acidimicrobiales bacterium]